MGYGTWPCARLLVRGVWCGAMCPRECLTWYSSSTLVAAPLGSLMKHFACSIRCASASQLGGYEPGGGRGRAAVDLQRSHPSRFEVREGKVTGRNRHPMMIPFQPEKKKGTGPCPLTLWPQKSLPLWPMDRSQSNRDPPEQRPGGAWRWRRNSRRRRRAAWRRARSPCSRARPPRCASGTPSRGA